jgi:trigger factor
VVDDADVDEQLDELRDRFGTLKTVEREAAEGDYVSLDLSTAVGGEDIEAGSAKGLSYVVGSGDLVEGLDDAVTGKSAGDTTTFTTTLRQGEHADEDAEVTATVKTVKVKELPELDDDFAQLASEFDTVDELRADLRERLGRTRSLEQGGQARDKVLEALLAQTEVALPEGLLETERSWRRDAMTEQLSQMGLSLDRYLEAQGQSREEFDAELASTSAETVKAQFILDDIAAAEQLDVTQPELIEALLRRSQQAGMDPQQYADELTRSGQITGLWAEVRRGKALAHVMSTAVVTDASGNPVDLAALDALAAPPHDEEAHARGEHDPAWIAEHAQEHEHEHEHEH